jgi:hypothetical protein
MLLGIAMGDCRGIDMVRNTYLAAASFCRWGETLSSPLMKRRS